MLAEGEHERPIPWREDWGSAASKSLSSPSWHFRDRDILSESTRLARMKASEASQLTLMIS